MKFRTLLIVSLLTVMPASVAASGNTKKADDEPQKSERSLTTQPTVAISMCVSAGTVDIHGWDKNEVAARSAEGAQIQLKRMDTGAESEPASKVQVLVLDEGDVLRTKNGCQATTDIELNVPRGATVQIQTRDGDVNIVDVAVAYAGTQNGNITMERVAKAIEVGTVGGDISIKDSNGRIDLTSIGGNVSATNLRSVDSSDTLEITTVSGEVDLAQVTHSRLNVRTVNGNMKLSGPLTRGGRYGVNTMSGDVTFALPADASFQLNAKVSSAGDIITDFPLTLLSQAVREAPTAPVTPTLEAPVTSATSVTAKTSGASSVKTVTVLTPAPPVARPQVAPPGEAPEQPVTPAPTIIAIDPEGKPKRVIKVQPVIVTTPYSMRRVSAVCGSGDATIVVASFSGTVHLQKD